MLVLDSLADDYEDRQKIFGEVSDLASRAGCSVTGEEVDDALAALVINGFVRAYLLSAGAAPIELQGMPRESTLLGPHEAYYFGLTPAGRALQMVEYPEWPFTSDGKLREGWQLKA